jgi:hypothetical protein
MKNDFVIWLRLFFCLIGLVTPGCAGYSLGSSKPEAMRDIRSLAVLTFQNKTLEPRMEVLFANALIKQIQQEGTFRVTREEDSDAVVHGVVERIDRTPARGLRSDFFQSTEFDLSVVVSLRVVERSTGKVLVQRRVKGNTSFFVSSTSAVTGDVNKDERQAIPLAAEDAAQRLVSYLADGW